MKPSLDAATSRAPSLEEASEVQFRAGAALCAQLVPPSEEVKILHSPFRFAATTANFVPSAEETTRVVTVGPIACVQVTPASFDINSPVLCAPRILEPSEEHASEFQD